MASCLEWKSSNDRFSKTELLKKKKQRENNKQIMEIIQAYISLSLSCKTKFSFLTFSK